MPALGHFWQQKAGKAADCQQEGILAHERCANCDLVQVDGVAVTEEALVIPAGKHTLESIPKSDATCTQAGTLAHEHCTVCDLLLVDNKPVEASQLTTGIASHVLSDWEITEHEHRKVCVDCGECFRNGVHKFGADGACTDCGYALNGTEDAAEEQQSFSWLFLIPIVAAVGITGALVVSMVLKKRK